MKGILKKSLIKKGKISAVVAGDGERGTFYRIINHLKEAENKLVEVENLKEVEEGDMLFVKGPAPWQYLKTSPIIKVIDISDSRIVVETETSEYTFVVDIEAKEENKHE